MPLQVLHDRQVAANGALSSIRLGFNYSYRASWIAIALGFTVALLTVFTSGVGIALDSVGPLACLVSMLVVAEVIYTRFRPDVRIGAACGILAVFSTASLLAAIISHTSLRLGFPYIDNALSNADMVLGIYAPAIVLLFAEHPDFANFLAFVYSTSLPVCIACGLVLAASGRISRAQELAFAFTFCILFASTVSIFFPALGSTVYHGIEGLPGLPSTAGNFHMATVAYYRDDPMATFDLGKIQGIVTFPSFHMVMAIMVPYAIRGTGIATWFAGAWAVLVTISAVVIGGHYIVDLLAGVITWSIAIWWIRLNGCEIRAETIPYSDQRSTDGSALS
jgi:membrane-associated phospholipid phosphatase